MTSAAIQTTKADPKHAHWVPTSRGCWRYTVLALRRRVAVTARLVPPRSGPHRPWMTSRSMLQKLSKPFNQAGVFHRALR
jgi:hypothetical protein